MSPNEAIVQACLLRFRPIMMTTLAALFGALPLAIESGTGAELRFPLGISIIGGLLLSQLLTLYTTPVIYLALDRLNRRLEQALPPPGPAGAAGRGRDRGDAVDGIDLRALHPPAGRHHAAGDRAVPARCRRLRVPSRRPVPNVDFPTIRVSASRPGADPSVMAATVASPLERRLGEIAGIDQITSTSSLGTTSIQLQFDIGRNIDRAARDVQAAINAALIDLPSDLPTLPRFRKANPAGAPVFDPGADLEDDVASAIYDVADTVLAQRISQVPGVGDVTVSGADQPAVRVRSTPSRCRTPASPPTMSGPRSSTPIRLARRHLQRRAARARRCRMNRQMRTAAEFRDIIIKSSNGNFVRLSDVADVEDCVRNSRSIAWFNKQPAVLIQITKQGDANVIDTVDRVKALIPRAEAMDSGRRRYFHAGRPHQHDPRQRARHAVDAAGDRRPRDGRGVRVPAAADADHRGRHLGAAGAGRDLCRDVARGLLDRQSVADGAGHLGRLRGRRRHRHDREHVPQSRAWHAAAPGRARRRPADRVHRGLDQPVADRGFHAADLHGRHRRPPAARVLADADLRDPGLDAGVAHGYADDLRPLHPADHVRDATLFDRLIEGSLSRIVAFYTRTLRTVLDSPADAAGVLRHHRADGDALHQDPQGLFPDRRFRLRHRRDARLGRHLVPVHARPAAAARRHRDAGSGRGRHRLDGRQRRRAGGRRPRTAAPCSSA